MPSLYLSPTNRNRHAAYGDGLFSFPVAGYTITSRFGPRINPVTKLAQNHGGVDLAVPVGTYVGAIGSGTVKTVVRDHPVAGHYVEVDHANGYWSRYLHLSRIDAVVGQPVEVGSQIGVSGGGPGQPGAGRSTGPHLHLEVWKGQPYRGGVVTDPLPYLTSQAKAAAVGAAKSALPAVLLVSVPAALLLWWYWQRRTAAA